MDDRACSEVCEAHGFARQAEFFRSLSEGRCVVHVVIVWPDVFRGDDEPNEGGEPALIFFDRGEAEREVERRNIQFFRGTNLVDLCEEFLGLDFRTSSHGRKRVE